MKKIAILGSTGSIGTQTLDIVRLNKDLKVTVLTANKNINLIFTQILEFCPEFVCIFDIMEAELLKERLETAYREGQIEKIPEITTGVEGLIEAAAYKNSDMVVTAVVGMIGIRPTIAAINAGKDIALANKETHNNEACRGKRS